MVLLVNIIIILVPIATVAYGLIKASRKHKSNAYWEQMIKDNENEQKQ